MTAKIFKIIFLSSAICLFMSLTACTEVENSSGKVLENAGSVVESGKNKLFMDPPPEEAKKR